MAVIEFTTGPVGSGKSYRRCAYFIVNELLNPKLPSAKGIWCNYPIMFEPWVDAKGVERGGLIQVVLAKYPEMTEEEIRSRVKVFPPEVVESWSRAGKTHRDPVIGPWDYFNENEVEKDGWHVAIDEIHNFAPHKDKKARLAWSVWLGEIRHEGVTIEFVTQKPTKVNMAIRDHAEVRRFLVKRSEDTDPYFGIILDDWYQLGTVFGKEYKPSVWQIEQREVMGKWSPRGMPLPFWFDPELFACYNTHSASNATGASGGGAEKPYELLSKLGLVAWFMRRNWFRFFCNKTVPRLAFVVGLLVFALNMGRIMSFVGKMRGTNPPAAALKAGGNGSPPVASSVDDRGDDLGEDRNELDANRIAELEALLEAASVELELASERTEAVVEFAQNASGGTFVVGMSDSLVVYANGQRGRVGDTVSDVFGVKREIERIEFDERKVFYFDGGFDLFRPDFGMLERVSKSRSDAAELREYLRTGERPNDNASRSRNGNAAGDVIGG